MKQCNLWNTKKSNICEKCISQHITACEVLWWKMLHSGLNKTKHIPIYTDIFLTVMYSALKNSQGYVIFFISYYKWQKEGKRIHCLGVSYDSCDIRLHMCAVFFVYFALFCPLICSRALYSQMLVSLYKYHV